VTRPDAPEVYLLEGTMYGDFARDDWKSWKVAPVAASSTVQ